MELMDKLFIKIQYVASLEDFKGKSDAHRQEYVDLIGFYECLVEELYSIHPETRAKIDQSIQRRIDICDMRLEEGK